MRRLTAYFLSTFTIFLGIGVAFKPVATNINGDLSFKDGKTLTFKLTDTENPKEAISDEDAAENYAAVIEDRLIEFGTTDYIISTEGNDTIKVTLTADNDEEYERVEKYLCVNSKISFSVMDETYEIAEGDDFTFKDSSAYIQYDGSTCIAVLPVPSSATTKVDELIEAAKKYEGGEKTSNDEEKYSIVMWTNRNGEKYADKSQTLVANKIVYEKFNSSNLLLSSDDKTKFQIKVTPASSSAKDVRDAYNETMQYIRIFNASMTDYTCNMIHEEVYNASIESLLVYGDHVYVNMGATFISLMISFILIALILGFVYRASAASMLASASLSAFVTFTIFTLFKTTFNIAGLFGIIFTFLAGLAIGIVEQHYYRDEIYKGRSMKKANFEASKKTTLLTVDISVISLIAGILTYFVGGKTVGSLGVILIIFSIANILINTFIFKGLNWLITNNTATQKNYKLFNIDESRVPNLANEEKQKYFGPVAEKDFTKKKKLFAGIFAGATAISIVAMIIFGSLGKSMFNSGGYFTSAHEASLLYTGDDEASQPVTLEEVENNVLKCIYKDNAPIKYDADSLEVVKYTTIYKESEREVTYNNYLYTVTILESDLDSNVFSWTTTKGEIKDSSSFEETLKSCVKENLPTLGITDDKVNVIDSTVYNVSSNIGLIIASSISASLIISLYFWIRRYRLSRILSLFAISTVSMVISIGLLTLVRINSLPIMAISSMFTILTTLLTGLFIMHKDKDMIKDERLRNIENRKIVLNKALPIAVAPMSVFATLTFISSFILLAVGNKVYAGAMFATSIGMIASFFMLVTLFTSSANYLDKKIANVSLPEFKIRKKKKAVVKSNEPEEAIFIGIND